MSKGFGRTASTGSNAAKKSPAFLLLQCLQYSSYATGRRKHAIIHARSAAAVKLCTLDKPAAEACVPATTKVNGTVTGHGILESVANIN